MCGASCASDTSDTRVRCRYRSVGIPPRSRSLLMTWRSIIDECTKKSADPRYPGSGKNPGVGFAIGVLFGAIGVGLYLRSLKEGLLSFAAAIVLCMILPDAWF